MAILNPPAYLQAGTYPASSDRLHQTSARFTPTTLSTSDVAARGGILPGQSARLFSASMTNWDVTIGKGVAIVENTFASQAGDYEALNTASQTLTVTASSPTTNRIDIIGIRIQDAFYSGAVNSGDLAVVQGTPAAGAPADPVLPSSFLPLWRVTVSAATTTGVLTDLRKRTNVMGSVYQPFTGQQADSGTVVGEMQLLAASGVYPARLRVWDGAAWKGVTPFQFDMPAQSGSGNFAGGAELTVTSLSVADPGYAYKLKVIGTVGWAIPTATQPNLLIGAGVTIDSTVLGTGEIRRGYQTSASIGASFTQPIVVASGNSASQTGAHTLRLIVHNYSGINFNIPAAGAETGLSVELVPA